MQLILNDRDEIVYLSTEAYDTFSFEVTQKELYTKTNMPVDVDLDLKLSDSSDPVIKNLNNTFRQKSGNEPKTIQINNDLYLLIFVKVPSCRWTVAYLIKRSTLYRSYYRINEQFRKLYNSLYLRYVLNFILITVVSFFLLNLLIKYIFIRPIESLKEQSVKIGQGKFDYKIKEKGVKELFELSKTFNNLGSHLSEFTENLKSEVKPRQTIETELNVAGKLQESILPKVTDKFINSKFELYAKLIPAKEMSGDFYDLFFINDYVLAIVLADVSGKGVPAAFFMSRAYTVVRETSLRYGEKDPGSILESVNATLCQNNEKCMFLTMYLFFYNVKTGKLTYSNAGHHGFITTDQQKNAEITGLSNTMAIGLFDGAKYTKQEITLKSGQLFAVFTDGIIEAPDKDDNEFGMERTACYFKEKGTQNLTSLGDNLIDKVIRFQEGKKFDDVTLVMLRRT